jgi:hypothetical protein
VLSILNNPARISLQGIASVLFNLSPDGTTVQEKISVSEENTSIHDLAKLGVLKVK